MFSVIANPSADIDAYTIPSTTPSNSSFFQKKKTTTISALEHSSTIGAEITSANVSPAFGSAMALTTTPPIVLRRNEKNEATSPPQKNAVASIHIGSAS